MNGREEIEPADIDKLLEATRHPRDRAFIILLARTGVRIGEVIQLKMSDIDFKRKTLTILHLKERIKLRCPSCGQLLSKRHQFCPGCGKKVAVAVREAIQKKRTRMIPVDSTTLRLLGEYLQWRRQFRYTGPLVFPFTRQRGWQILKALGHRIGVKSLHPHSFRHLLATSWVNRGLDTKKLQVLLGHQSISTTWRYVDSSLEGLRAELGKLWDEDGKTEGQKEETYWEREDQKFP